MIILNKNKKTEAINQQHEYIMAANDDSPMTGFTFLAPPVKSKKLLAVKILIVILAAFLDFFVVPLPSDLRGSIFISSLVIAAIIGAIQSINIYGFAACTLPMIEFILTFTLALTLVNGHGWKMVYILFITKFLLTIIAELEGADSFRRLPSLSWCLKHADEYI